MTEPMVALMTTAEVAALQPFDAEPLAIVRRGTPHHLVSPSMPRYRRADVMDWLGRLAA